jgi:hypothetical protein
MNPLRNINGTDLTDLLDVPPSKVPALYNNDEQAESSISYCCSCSYPPPPTLTD